MMLMLQLIPTPSSHAQYSNQQNETNSILVTVNYRLGPLGTTWLVALALPQSMACELISLSLSLSLSQDSWALRLAPTTLDCSINELPWNGFRTTLMSSMVIRSKSRSLARVPEAAAWRSIS